MNPRTTTRPRRTRLLVAGAVAAGLSVAGTAAAVAANASGGAPAATGTQAAAPAADAPVGAADAVEADPAEHDPWAAMPEGYTREQYEALWSSGYTMDDINALGELWQVEGSELKARIGQAILDGEELPVAPGSTAPGPQYGAFWEAGYTVEDLDALISLWGTPWDETKLRAGQAILDGQALPVPPSGTPAS